MSNKQNNDIAEPDLDRGRSVIINGALVPAAQAAEICKRKGLCRFCAETRTHVRKRVGLMHKMEPVTEVDANGNYLVYKGYCIKPLCYSLDQAKRELGEEVDARPGIQRPKSKRKEKKSSKRHAVQESPPTATVTPFPPSEEDRSGSSNDLSYGSDLSPRVSSTSIKHNSSVEDINFDPYPRRNSERGSTSNRASVGALHRRSTSSDECRYIPESPSGKRSSAFDRNRDDSGYHSYSDLEGFSPTLNKKQVSNSTASHQYSSGSMENASSSSGRNISLKNANSSSGRNLSLKNMGGAPMPPDLQRMDEVAINELERFAHEQRYRDFMDTLCSNYTLANVMKKAFQLLRDTVHIANQTCGYVFSSQTPWVKYIDTAMESNSNNQAIQADGILTFWTLAAVGPKYMKEIGKSSGVDAVLATLDRYRNDEQIVEICCGALECLTSNPDEGISMNHWAAKKIVHSLVRTITLDDDVVHHEDNFDVVREDSGSSKLLALRALYNLSLEEAQTLTDTIKDALPDANDGLEAILAFAKKGDNVDAVEWAIRLLWSLSSSAVVPIPSFELIETAVGVLDKFDNPDIQEAAFGLLSSAKITEYDAANAPVGVTQKIAESVVVSATSAPLDKSIQLSSINVLSGICSNPDRLGIVAEMDVVRVAIDAMNAFPEDVDVQGAACIMLAYLCGNETTKAAMSTSNAINTIVTTFRLYVVEQDAPPGSSESFELIKEGTCTALASLSMQPQTAIMLINAGILSDVDLLLRNYDNSVMPSSLRAVVVNTLAAKAQATDEGQETDHHSITLAMETLKSCESETEAETLMAAIHSTTCASPHSFDFVLSAKNGDGMEILLTSLENFPKSEIVQMSGCAILANLYVKIPYNGALNQKTRLTVGSTMFDVETHTEREVKLLLSALNNHKGKALVQEYGCNALCNFVVGSYSEVVPCDVEIPEEVVAAYSGTLKKIIDAFSIHQDSLEVQRSACRLLLVMAYFNEEVEMKRWALHGITKTLEAMSKFSEDGELNLVGFGVMLTVLDDEMSAQFIGSSDGVRAMLRCLHFQDEEIVEQASLLLDLIMQKVYATSNEFMLIEDSIESVILCMNEHVRSASIQTSLCSVLSSLVSLQDSFVKGLIGNNGGLNALQATIRTHRHDEMVVECGCKALSGVVGGCMPDLICQERHNIGEILMGSLTDHPNNIIVQDAVLGALWGLCAREESFSDYIAGINGLPIIIDSMNQHVLEEQVVASGCSLLWIMASYGDENKRRIGRAGIRAVVQGMLVHIASSAVQKEALTALKNLATDLNNKVAATELGAVQAIVQSMWVHMKSPQILCAAFSALNNIAVDSVNRKVARADQGELTAICCGMTRHAHDHEVQKCATFLLKSYTFAPSNLPLMRSEEELIGLLTIAAETFPGECSERASFVLRRI